MNDANGASSQYALITPAHNEADFLPEVIETVARQTVPPRVWIIVDDRSTDRTWSIIEEAAGKHAFIRPIRIEGERLRSVGPNVVHVFNRGLAELREDTEFIVKMDADLLLEPTYFETLLRRFDEEPKLGIASGKIYLQRDGQWIMERFADFHVTGACKMYRRACYLAIGGQMPILGWDIVDAAKARSLGWITRSYSELPLFHLRQTGAATGMIRSQIRYGRSAYVRRNHPLFVLGRAVYRAVEKPYLSSLLIVVGYFMAALRREKRLDDPDLVRFMRKEQLQRVTGRTMRQERIVARRWMGPEPRHVPLSPPTSEVGPAGRLPKVSILGVRVTNASRADIHREIDRLIDSGGPAFVLSANVNGLNLAQKRPWMIDFYNRAQIVRVDGAGVLLAARLLGSRLGERITWADWAWPLSDFLADGKRKIFLLGGPPGLADEAAEKLKAHRPDLQIAGVRHGYFQPDGPENDEVVERIRQASPDVLWVGMGMPRQEKWILDNYRKLNVPLFMVCGRAFMYMAGRLGRSPRWLIRLHSEWLYCLLEDPKRGMGRYVYGNPVFLARVLWERFGPKRSPREKAM